MSDVWRWEVRDRQGEISTLGQIQMWGEPEEQKELAERWASDKFAIMLYDAEPHYETLTGWLVRVWSDRLGYEAVSLADDWLETLQRGVLARMRDRVELLPRRRPANRSGKLQGHARS